MLDFIKTCIATIQHAPICDLDKRQQRLIELLTTIVNHETENGKLTSEAGNTALEAMPYWRSMGEYLRDAGFVCLGNGHFSAAYKHSLLPGKAIKVGFKKEDSGAAYVAFCRMHQGLPGIPVIHDIQRHAGCYTVIMDALISLDEAYEKWGEEVYGMHSTAESGVEGAHIGEFDLNKMDDWRAGLYRTGLLINKFFKGIARFDMHGGNVMFDPNTGKVYITDPVSFSLDTGGNCKFSQDDWALDIEAIERERAEAERVHLIARCKKRWAANRLRKEGLQSRACKARRKAVKKRRQQEKLIRVKQVDNQILYRLARMQMDPAHLLDVRCRNLFGCVEEVLRINAEAFRVDNHGRIFAGLPLACDVELDKRFLG